jgi:hypothetical protein
MPDTFAVNRIRLLWDGASRKTSYSGVIWDGTVKIGGAKIQKIEKIRFDSPRSCVSDITDNQLRWHSVICGYKSGIILELDGLENARLDIAANTTLISGPKYGGQAFLGSMGISYRPAEKAGFSVDLDELKKGPVEIDVGTLNRKLTVSLAPEETWPDTAEFTFTDPNPKPGVNPYWVRVVQTDMEMAWTSPVFVDYVSG